MGGDAVGAATECVVAVFEGGVLPVGEETQATHAIKFAEGLLGVGVGLEGAGVAARGGAVGESFVADAAVSAGVGAGGEAVVAVVLENRGAGAGLAGFIDVTIGMAKKLGGAPGGIGLAGGPVATVVGGV